MALRFRFIVPLLWCLALTARAQGEVLVRWDQDQVPSRHSLGLSTLVVPAKNSAAVQSALAQGFDVYLEIEAARAATVAPASGVRGVVVKGTLSKAQLTALRTRLKPRNIAVRTLEERGKWPHIRSNWVTNNNGVLQVSSRTAQPWIENNAALIRIAQAAQPGVTPMLSYAWTPITLSDKDEGPATENYLVAISEAGSFGADLLLPLHASFQKSLLLGDPSTRAGWRQIQDAIEFYSWNLPNRYRSAANIAVVTGPEPLRWFEVMNLLARHSLPFELVTQDALATRDLAAFELLIVLDAPTARQAESIAAFARRGGTVVMAGLKGSFPWQKEAPTAKTEEQVTYPLEKGRVVEVLQPVANPDKFALDMRRLLGRDRRAIQMWNGITVIAATYTSPDQADGTVLLSTLNYTHQKLPVQLRVRGTFSAVEYESPDEPATLLPYTQRDGFTEFLLPALRVGGRVFLKRDGAGS